MSSTDLLIVGAGPFGLALAAEAGHQGVPHHVVGRPMSFWQQQIFAGKDVPPDTKASDADVIAFVSATPGAIGYVSAGAAVAGVKVVKVGG